MLNKIIIFGGHIQALGLARQAKNLCLKVIICVDDKHCVAAYSNTVDTIECYNTTDELCSIVHKYASSEKDCLLFPTNDEMVEFLADKYDELKDNFCLGIPNPDTVNLFNDKRQAYQFAEQNGINAPKCWYPDTIEEVYALSDTLSYPVVVKPAVMYSFHKTFGKKAFRCDTKEDLLSVYSRIADHNYDLTTIIIQEFLNGGPKYLFSYATFAANGESKVSIMANRIRQNPMDFGNSTTFAVTCDVSEIKESAEKLLMLTNYFGLGEVEFMYDPISKTYKFLEINTRAWKWHTISNQLGFCFIDAMVNYFNGYNQTISIPFKKVGWVERLTDWTVAVKEILKGRMSISIFLNSYNIQKEYAVWSSKDPKPFFMYILLSPILFIKRH